MLTKLMQEKKLIIGTIIYILITLGISGLLYMNRCGKEYHLFNRPEVVEQGNNLETTSLALPKGDYYLVVNYVSNKDIPLTIYLDREHQIREVAPKNEECGYYTLNFTITQSTSLFHIIAEEGLVNGFKLFNYEITGSRELNRDDTFYAIVFLLIAVIFYVLYFNGVINRLTDKQKIVAVSLIGLVVFTSYPMFTNYLVYGHDLHGHLMRIEGVKDALRDGHILAEIYPENNNGYGMLGFIYPNLFLHIPACLRLCDVSMVTAYHTFLVLINVATAIAMYFSVKSITKTYLSALLGTILYMLAPYRLCDLYIRSAIGESLAMIFFPLVIAGLYHILIGDKRRWYYLLIGLTGVTQSHVLSCLQIGFICVVLCIVFIKHLFIEKRFCVLIKTVSVFLIANLWYIIPFFIYYSKPLGMKVIENTDFYDESVFGAQLFMTNAFVNLSSKADVGIQEEMPLSIGMIGWIAAFLIITYLIGNRKQEHLEDKHFILYLFMISLGMLFMSTSAFPWYKLTNIAFVSSLLGMIQFTFRFLAIATICLSFSCAIVVERAVLLYEYKKLVLLFVLALGMVGSYELLDAYTIQEVMHTEYSGGFSDNACPEYLPAETDETIFKDTSVRTDGVEVEDFTRQGTSISFTYRNASKEAFVTLPILYYPGYEAKLEDGTRLITDMGEQNRLRVYLTEEKSQGKVSIHYSYWALFMR